MIRHTQRRILRSVVEGIRIDVSENKGIRYLHLDEDDVQSAMRIKAPNELVLAYSRVMMGILLFLDSPGHAALIGLGGGSLPKFIYHYLPAMTLDVAELYHDVVMTARGLFFLPEDDERLRVHVMGGEDFIPTLTEPVDIIFHDAFGAAGIVRTLVSEAFLEQCHDRLSTEGALVINLWGSDKNTPLYIDRIKRIFTGGVLQLPAFPDKNRIVYAFKQRPRRVDWQVLRSQARKLEQTCPLDFSAVVGSLTEYNFHNDRRLVL